MEIIGTKPELSTCFESFRGHPVLNGCCLECSAWTRLELNAQILVCLFLYFHILISQAAQQNINNPTTSWINQSQNSLTNLLVSGYSSSVYLGFKVVVGGFQPLWTILVKMGIFPRKGVKIKKIWNHHPAIAATLSRLEVVKTYTKWPVPIALVTWDMTGKPLRWWLVCVYWGEYSCQERTITSTHKFYIFPFRFKRCDCMWMLLSSLLMFVVSRLLIGRVKKTKNEWIHWRSQEWMTAVCNMSKGICEVQRPSSKKCRWITGWRDRTGQTCISWYSESLFESLLTMNGSCNFCWSTFLARIFVDQQFLHCIFCWSTFFPFFFEFFCWSTIFARFFWSIFFLKYFFVDQQFWHIQPLLSEEILQQLIGSLSHYLRGFIHSRWCFSVASCSLNTPLAPWFDIREATSINASNANI